MSVRKGVIGKWWAPNYYHLSANLHRITRTLAIKRAPYLQSSEGHHNVHWAMTQPLNYLVKRCTIGLIVPRFCRLHVHGKMTCVWKVNDYFQSWSWVTETADHHSPPSAISPSIQENHLFLKMYLLIPGLLLCLNLARSHSSISMNLALQRVWLPIPNGLDFNFELDQHLCGKPGWDSKWQLQT